MTVHFNVRITRADGYRQLGMYEDACWELEELEGSDRLENAVLHCRWLIYRDSENWLGATSMAAEMARRKPGDSDWRIRNAHALRMDDDEAVALAYLLDEAGAFGEDPAYLYELGRYKCLTGDLKGARDAVRKAIRLDKEYRGPSSSRTRTSKSPIGW